MTDMVAVAQDRSMLIPPGSIVETGYVSVWKCVFATRERMAVGDVDRAFQKRIQMGDHQSWPCPRGYWIDDEFIIVDGRHELIAALMLGIEYILVAWVKEGNE